MAKILVVEDTSTVRKLLCKTLEKAGHRVAEAEQGDDALKILSEDRFDVVITDLNMPGICGDALIAKLRETAPSAKIIAITGEGTADSTSDPLAAAKQAGAHLGFQKPIPRAELLVAIRELLD